MTYPTVIAAAIIGKDTVCYSLVPPARHHDVIAHMIETGLEPPIEGIQGFLLSDGTFATRIHAKICAKYNHQLLERASKLDELFSEDVW